MKRTVLLSFFLIYLLLSLSIQLSAQQLKTGVYEGKIDTIANNEIRILSWNIRMLPRFAFKHAFGNSRRARLLPQKIIDDQIDIVIFQELFDRKNFRMIKRRMKRTYPYRIGPANRKFLSPKSSSGVVIYSKLPIRHLGEVDFEGCKGPDCLARKGALLVEAEYKGQKFQVLGTHLEAGRSPEIKIKQYDEILSLVNKFRQDSVPQFLTGDFNTHRGREGDPLYEIMIDTLEVEDGPFVSADKYTSSYLLDWFKKKNRKIGEVIDFILVRKNGAQPKRMDRYVRIYKHPWHKKKGFKNLSDHHAVLMRLEFE